MWLGVVAGAGTLIYHFSYTIEGFEKWMIAATLVAVGTALLLLILLVHPRVAKLEAQCKELEEAADGLEQTAWQQMETLNGLYDWDVLTRMMEKTVPPSARLTKSSVRGNTVLKTSLPVIHTRWSTGV